jgi:uncharacterized membrane protein (UPF0127 family)
MPKEVLLPVAGIVIFIVLIGTFFKNGSLFKQNVTSSNTSPQTLGIGDKNIAVEIVNTESSRRKGLGRRESLKEDYGMLFVFDSKPVSPIFWMKDMLIPLDIIWITNGKIVQINKSVPAPGPDTPDSKLDKLTTIYPVDYVLEVNAGFSEKNNIAVGDTVTLPSGY